jgi:4-hydroxybenzoate polyprenyltransferase
MARPARSLPPAGPSTPRAWWNLLRPVNLALMALAEYLAHALLLALDGPLSGLGPGDLARLVGATVLAAAGGNILNDLVDREADARFKPGRNPVGRELDLKTTGVAYGAASAGALYLGIELAARLGGAAPFWPGWWVVAAVAGLAVYALWAQHAPLLGNALVAALTALAVLLPALYRGWGGPSAEGLLPFAALAFLGSWTREWVKDLEDRTGDAATGSRTAAVRWPRASRWGIAALLGGQALLVVALAARLAGTAPPAAAWALPVGLAYVGLAGALWRARDAKGYGRASAWAKAVLLAGVLWMGILAAAVAPGGFPWP